jgi:ankyrin repeat protein
MIAILGAMAHGIVSAQCTICDPVRRGDVDGIRRQLQRDRRLANQSDVDGNRPLLIAAARGDLTMIRLLLKYGASPRVWDLRPYTPLHFAVESSRLDIVDLLLKAGADVNAVRGEHGESPLHVAARSGDTAMILFLVKHHAKLDVGNGGEGTPLMSAILWRQLAVARLLVRLGASVDAVDATGHRAIAVAARSGDPLLFHLLLDRGAVAHTSAQGDFLLMSAAVAGMNPAIIAALIERGVRCDGRHSVFGSSLLHIAASSNRFDSTALGLLLGAGLSLDARDNAGRTPLSIAAEERNLPFVHRALAGGAAVDIRDVHGQTALLWGCRTGDTRIVRELVEHGADLKLRDDLGYTPLIRACARGDVDLVRFLVDHGANILARADDGTSALAQTVFMMNRPVVEYLIEHAAFDPSELTDGGETLLHLAAVGREGIPFDSVVADRLLNEGVMIDAVDASGTTPLMKAVRFGRTSSTLYLIRRGADLSLMDREGHSALDLSAMFGRDTIMSALFAAGAGVPATGIDGTSLLHRAVESGRIAVVRIVLEHGGDCSFRDRSGQTALMLARRLDVPRAREYRPDLRQIIELLGRCQAGTIPKNEPGH